MFLENNLPAYRTPGERVFEPKDILGISFQCFLALLFLFFSEEKLSALEHLGWAAGIFLFLKFSFPHRHRLVVGFLRDFYLLLLLTPTYEHSGKLIHAFFPWTIDAFLLRLDAVIGGGPALWSWQDRVVPPKWLNELFHAGYSFYYVLIPGTALVLWFKASRKLFENFLFFLIAVYYVHYFLFMLLPAHSPRLFVKNLAWPLEGYALTRWLVQTVQNHAFAGGSFPSSHAAAAVLCLRAWPYLPWWGKGIWAFGTLLLLAGTVWGRYHYVVDIVAGVAAGVVFLKIVGILEKRWEGQSHD